MPMIVACKLPHGLVIAHNGQTLNINGSNSDIDPLAPINNGAETQNTPGGYGLTELNDDQAKAFEDWRLHALFNRGADGGPPAEKNGLLVEPFLPLTNGAIMTFKDEGEARKELRANLSLNTGFGGIDGDAEAKAAAEGTGLQEVGTDKTKDGKKG